MKKEKNTKNTKNTGTVAEKIEDAKIKAKNGKEEDAFASLKPLLYLSSKATDLQLREIGVLARSLKEKIERKKKIAQLRKKSLTVANALGILNFLVENDQGNSAEFRDLYSDLVSGRISALTLKEEKELTQIFAASKRIAKEAMEVFRFIPEENRIK